MKTSSTLFIIDSPLQALCALEAIAFYGIKDVDFAVQDDEIVRQKTIPLLTNKGIIHVVSVLQKNTYSIAKSARNCIPYRYKRVVIGDYFSFWQYVVASSVSRVGAEHIYLDDGNSTLDILPPVSRRRGKGRGFMWFGLVSFCNRFKFIKTRLFTFFDLGDKSPIPYDINTFDSLVGDKCQDSNSVYVIGTNSEKLLLRNYSYIDYLHALAAYIKTYFPGKNVYYCPHRMDSNDYSKVIQSMGWNFFHTEISVEVDLVKNKVVPSLVIGFGSTALLTLKQIFKKTSVKSIYVDLSDEDLNKSYRSIEEYYRNNGIEIVKLY